ncbi:MAG: DNA double-strand break repair nuclease NurA [Caldilineaceae bacterium]
MLSREKVIDAFERKRSFFSAYAENQRSQQRLIDQQLSEFYQLSAAEINHLLANIPWPGALPTLEFDQAKQLRMPFAHRWQNHSEARSWALEILRNRTVIAVDGSQITPNKDLAPPIAAIQIGWFINDHRIGGSYRKDVEFDVLAPTELDPDLDGDLSAAASIVNQERFERECQKLMELMHSFADREEKPLCLFDGSFIASFASQLQANTNSIRRYLQRTSELLRTSQQLQVPLLAFVDSSLSHDLTTMIRNVLKENSGKDGEEWLKQTDGEFLSPQHLATGKQLSQAMLPYWGDRTPFFFCARNDKLTSDVRTGELAEYYRDVAFCYIQFNMDRPPARLEIPRWLLESGQAEGIANLLRAESVVGSGYPYAIETADALAVISMQDRERFYALYQQYLKGYTLEISQTRKSRSKLARR